jgi:exoribonuclease R
MTRTVEILSRHPAADTATNAMLAANPTTAEDASEVFYSAVLDQMATWLQHHQPSAAFRRVLHRAGLGLSAAAVDHE